jgi:DNA-binding CsgD family transcriptional regulator
VIADAHPLATKFPDMNDKDFAALVADIQANGQREPAVIFQGQILDGRHRARACAMLGIDLVTTVFEGDEEAAARLVDSLNVHRRHLTREQRRLLIESELKRDPSQSNRAIAEEAGVSHHTVASARAHLEDTGQIAQSDIRIGKNGVEKPARKAAAKDAAEKAKAQKSEAEKPARLNSLGRRITLPENRRHRDERVEEIKRLAAEGNNEAQIAAAQGIGISHLRNLMAEAGIKLAIPKTTTVHADATHAANAAVDTLAGVAQGITLFRNSGIRIAADAAKELLPELRRAMKAIRWLEQQLKESSNG